MARKGILGTKLGMTQVFDENNRVVPVTVVKAGPNVVTRIRTPGRTATAPCRLPTARSARGQQAGHRSVRRRRGQPAPSPRRAASRRRGGRGELKSARS